MFLITIGQLIQTSGFPPISLVIWKGSSG